MEFSGCSTKGRYDAFTGKYYKLKNRSALYLSSRSKDLKCAQEFFPNPGLIHCKPYFSPADGERLSLQPSGN